MAYIFGLAFVVRYNSIMHKTQPQKLIFLAFHSFLVGPTPKPQPPPLTQTPTQTPSILLVAARQYLDMKLFKGKKGTNNDTCPQ